MATFSNIGIKLITTGDESGTWGDTTNANFSAIIDEAIAGVVTFNIATDADATLTVTDGSSSDARHIVINFTSTTLSATRTITFAPSTLEKTWLVVNSTTGGQSLTFKQGSAGATVTVPNGESAWIYSNGAGATNGAIFKALNNTTNSKFSTGELNVDNINIDGNAIISTNTNGNIALTPNGTGEVDISKVDIDSGAIDGTAIGASSASTGAFTTLSASSTATLSNLTASTALALDASKNIVSVTNTGTGNNVLATSPTLTTPDLGTPSAIVLTNASGTASININGTVGATTPSTGAFTTLGATGAVSLNPANANVSLAPTGTGVVTINPATAGTMNNVAIGGTTAAAGAFTTLTTSSTVTLNGGTANGVLYLNGSKEATSGSALVFDGTNLGIGTSSPAYKLDVQSATSVLQVKSTTGTNPAYYIANNTGGDFYIGRENSAGTTFGTTAYSSVLWSAGLYPMSFFTNGLERLRIDSSGNLGLGVTPSAWALSGSAALQVKNAGFWGYNNDAYVFANTYVDSGGGTKYIANGFASYYHQTSGEHRWITAASGSAGGTVSGTQAMTLNASGQLMLGTTTAYNRIHVNGSGEQYIRVGAATGTDYRGFVIAGTDADSGVYGQLKMELSGGQMQLVAGAAGFGGFLTIHTNGTERARITSGGDVLINSTANTWSSRFYVEVDSQNASVMEATNAAYAQNGFGIFGLNAVRAADSAYTFLGCYSGDGGDREFNLRGDGNGYADGTWNNNGADYAEYFESATGGALTVGATVVLDGNKVREATASDPVSAIMGVVRPKEPSKASMIVGNTAWNKWANKYLTDDFDRYIMEDHDVVEWTDADGKEHSYESHRIPDGVAVPADAVVKTHDDKGNKFQHYKLNPAWDKDAEYIPREKRDEWIIVGLVGQVKVLKGKPVNDRWIKMRDVSATVEEWMIR